jgi:hypothetical protein
MPAEFARPLQWIAGALIALALVHVAGVLWQRLRIARDNDRLVIRSNSLWPSRREYALSALRGMNIIEEEVRSSRKSGYRFLGWRWRVVIHLDDERIEFLCDARGRLAGSTACPERVAQFAQHLQRITGLPCPPPQRVEWGAGRAAAVRTGRTLSIPLEPQYRSETYQSLEEMPPDVRRFAEERLARMRAEGATTAEFQQFTVRDGEGRVQTYRSLDEMPPELRQRFEAARRQSRKPRE